MSGHNSDIQFSSGNNSYSSNDLDNDVKNHIKSTVSDPSKVFSTPQFSPEQERAILEHLLISKYTAPVKMYPHVPCKFYKMGNCQAGENCPFSHDISSNKTMSVCKYYKRGNCKFGEKCCNLHVLPDERVYENVICTPQQLQEQLKPIQQQEQHNIHQCNATPHQYYNQTKASNIAEKGLYHPDTHLNSRDIEGGEDFLPSELNDLLTPTELDQKKRRESTLSNMSFNFSSQSSCSSYPQLQYPKSRSSSNSNEPIYTTSQVSQPHSYIMYPSPDTNPQDINNNEYWKHYQSPSQTYTNNPETYHEVNNTPNLHQLSKTHQ